MPFLSIQTNKPIDDQTGMQLMKQASKTVSEILSKPENYVMIALPPAMPMLFAGNDQPQAYLELKSIGLPTEATTQLSESLCAMINSALGIPKERIYIEFADAQRNMWGWNGRTF